MYRMTKEDIEALKQGLKEWNASFKDIKEDLDKLDVDLSPSKALAQKVISLYLTLNSYERDKIRKLLEEYQKFLYWFLFFLDIDYENFNETQFRNKLIFLSIYDHGADTRDFLLELRADCKEALIRDIDVENILKEIAELSSDVNKYRMGSTKHIMLNDLYIWKAIKENNPAHIIS